jgi:tetrahydromethanopterin S-methyltransferase subunit D
MSHAFHKSYLKITAFVIGSFGPIFFLGAMPQTAEPARWTLDLLSYPLDGIQNYDAPTIHFLSALTGGFLLGWGVCVWCLQKWVYDAAPEGVRKSVLAGLLAWFLLDSSGSIASGNPSNVIFNCMVLLLAAGPLWMPAKKIN